MFKQDTNKRGHAIALYSGGLDSTLAILLILRQNIKVTAVTFKTHFGCNFDDRASSGANLYSVAEKFGFDVKLIHLGQKFVDIVVNPKYGWGKNMNPCTDCRILMLKEAHEIMELLNADFIITGEVLGQRPMSQVRDKLNLVVNKTGLKGKLLRPLSAKLLPPTEPELNGLVNREEMENIQGRSRKRQIELAHQFDLDDYPNPASGCLLTDVNYSMRLRDLIAHTDNISFDDINLLRVGRHFRFDATTKIIIGRNEVDNNAILAYRRPHHIKLEALNCGSPITLLIGNQSEENIVRAAAITARYTSLRRESRVEITVGEESEGRVYVVVPASDDEIQKFVLR